MCARYSLLLEGRSRDEFTDLFGPLIDPDLLRIGDILPTDEAPITIQERERTTVGAKWGLVPSWADDPKIGTKMINARAETLAERPAYREAFRRRRCLIPMSGFYEWAGKRRHRFSVPEAPFFAVAGLWEVWNDLRTFTLITTTPNDLVGSIHDRMPAVLLPEDFGHWLNPAASEKELTALLAPVGADHLLVDPPIREDQGSLF